EKRFDFARLGNVVQVDVLLFLQLFFDDVVAELNAFVADVDTGTGDKSRHLILILAAKRAFQLPFFIGEFEHRASPSAPFGPAAERVEQNGIRQFGTFVGYRTSSITPYSFAASADIQKSRSVSFSIFSIGCL